MKRSLQNWQAWASRMNAEIDADRRAERDAARSPTTGHLCKRCQQKQAQWRGLCRSCGRAMGIYISRREQDALRVEHQHARLEGGKRPPKVDLEPRPTKTRIIDGVEYEVTWDGT